MIAKADFVKDFHKIMKDVYCRKTIEIVRKRTNLLLKDESGT